MGRDKAMLTHPSGVTFLDYATSRADEVCDQIVLSGENRYGSLFRTLEDPLPFRGPITGIATALAMAARESFDGCLVTPVDLPFLSVEDLDKIKDTWQHAPDRLVCGVCEDRVIQPLVAIYPTRLNERLCQIAQSEDRSLNRWIRGIDHDVVSLPSTSCQNINVPEDWPPKD